MEDDLLVIKQQDINNTKSSINSFIEALNNISTDLSSASSCLSFSSSIDFSGATSKVSDLTKGYNDLTNVINRSVKMTTKLDEKLGEELESFDGFDILGFGKGPLNPEFVEDPTGFYIKKEQEKLHREKMLKYYSDAGLTPEDAKRIVNKEITPEELYDEITSEFASGDGTRYKAILDSTVLSSFYFVRSESEAQLEQQKQILEMLSDENIKITAERYESDINSIQAVIDSVQYDEKTGLYYGVNSNNEEVSFSKEEFQELKNSLNTKKETLDTLLSGAEEQRKTTEKNIEDLTKELSDSSKKDFTITTMGELDAKIAECDEKIANLGTISARFVNGRYIVPIPEAIKVEKQEGVDDLIDNEMLDGKRQIGDGRTQEIFATSGTGGNIYIRDTNDGYTEHIKITVKDGEYIEVVERQSSSGNWETTERVLPKQKATFTFEDENGHKESFTTFSGSETLVKYFDQYWYDKVDSYPPIAEGTVTTKSGKKVTIHIDTSDGEEFAGYSLPYERSELSKYSGRYEEQKYNYEDTIEAKLYNDTMEEKERLLAVKSQVDGAVSERMKLDWYRFQPDFEEKSKFIPYEELSKIAQEALENHDYDNVALTDGPMFLSNSPADCVYSHYSGDKIYHLQSVYRTADDIERERWQEWAENGAIEKYGELTEEDILPIYAYICNTEGFTKGGEFLEKYSQGIDKVNISIQTQKDIEYANTGSEWERSLKNAWTLVSNIGHSMDASADMWTLRFAGRDIYGTDIYNPAQTIHETYRNSYYKNGKVFGTIMDGLYSMDQMGMNFLLAAALGGGGSGAGASSMSSPLLNSSITSSILNPGALGAATIVYGIPSFNSTYYDAKVNRNLSDDKALFLAGATATTEIMMESMATSHLLGLDAMCENVINSGITSGFADRLVGLSILKPEVAQKTLATVYCMLSQGIFEFNEEFETTILDYTWDKLITGNESKLDAKINNYKKIHSGCSEVEAIANAVLEINQEATQAGEMAFVESLIFAGMTAGGGSNISNPLGVDYDVNNNSNMTFNNVQDVFTALDNNRITTDQAKDILLNGFDENSNQYKIAVDELGNYELGNRFNSDINWSSIKLKYPIFTRILPTSAAVNDSTVSTASNVDVNIDEANVNHVTEESNSNKGRLYNKLAAEGLENNGVIEVNDQMESEKVPLPEKLDADGVIMVRATNVLPTNGVITSQHTAGVSLGSASISINGESVHPNIRNRRTINVAMNCLVTEVSQGNNWRSMPYIILEPFTTHVDSSFKGGFTGDSFFDQDVKLSDDAIIMVNKQYYDEHQAELPSNYQYVVYEGDSNECVNLVLNKLGYYVQKSEAQRSSDSTSKSYPFEKLYEDMINRYNEDETNDFNAVPGLVDFYSIQKSYSNHMDSVEASLEYLRSGTVKLGDQQVNLTNDEAKLIMLQFIENKGSNLYTKMLNSNSDLNNVKTADSLRNNDIARTLSEYGIKYDPVSKSFSVVTYDEFLSRYDHIDENSAEVTGVYDFLRNSVEDERNVLQNRENYRAILEKLEERKPLIKPLFDSRGINLTRNTSIDLHTLIDMSIESGMNIEEFMSKNGLVYDTKANRVLFVENLSHNAQTEISGYGMLDFAAEATTADMISNPDLVELNMFAENGYEHLNPKTLREYVDILDASRVRNIQNAFNGILNKGNLTERQQTKIDFIMQLLDDRMTLLNSN